MRQGPYIFSVHELTRFIKTTLERESPLQGLLVRGEISNCKYHSSGHLYFTLKDETSQLPCVMWRDRVRAQSIRIENGMRVTAEGSITVYDRGGYYQLSAYDIQADGIGNLYLAFEQLKQKLSMEGLFATERKRPIPTVPRRIALISSPTGAVVHDFMTVSERRWPGRNIIIIPTAVQGVMAPASIVHSLELATHLPDVDVIVIARGGGSFEELACFNDETVARTIAVSPIPVVSAVGHETDFTIADFVADLRAPTPSAAAEMVVPDLRGIDEYLQQMERRVFHRAKSLLLQRKRDLERTIAHPSMRNPQSIIRERQQTVDVLSERITDRMKNRMNTEKRRLESVESIIAALDPRGVLLRGYAIVSRKDDGSVITSGSAAKTAQKIAVQFADISVNATVTDN
ncbi:MAG TPA: exodeoxyribonuclease VII large subunit [Armatimonadota bacterium]|nr:exodeoxyribonuclease VII large subunit [Armatimonadota bacterium]